MPVQCLIAFCYRAVSLVALPLLLLAPVARAGIIEMQIRIDGFDMSRYGGPVGTLQLALQVDADHDQDPTPDFGIFRAPFVLSFGGVPSAGSDGWLKVGNTGRGFPDDLVASLMISSRHFPGVTTTSEFPYLELHLVGDSDMLFDTDAVPTDAGFFPHIAGAKSFLQVSVPSSGISRVIETSHRVGDIALTIAPARVAIPAPSTVTLLAIGMLALFWRGRTSVAPGHGMHR